MNETENWYQSRGVWGGILAVLAAVAGAFGYTVSPEIQAEAAGLIVTAVGGIGGLLAIIGRIKATKRIG